MRKKRTLHAMTAGVAAILVATCLVCAGCQPSVPSEAGTVKGGETAEKTIAWSSAADCGACHVEEQASVDDAACLASMHEPQGIGCVDCHTDEVALDSAHASMDASKVPSKLKKSEVPNEVCLSCHDRAEIARETEGVEACTDSKGTTVNPHDLPANDDHEKVVCGDCHSMHSTEKAEDLASEKCISCHHQNVYECFTCHE